MVSDALVMGIVSITTTGIGFLVFLIKRFKRCKCGCVECECKGSEQPNEVTEVPPFNSSPI